MLGETSSCLDEGKEEQHQEVRLEAAKYSKDQKMQDLHQDVPHVIDSKFSAKNGGDVSDFQNIKTKGHQDHNVESIGGKDSEELVVLQGKNSDGPEVVGGQPSLEAGNGSAIKKTPSEVVTSTKEVSTSDSHLENTNPNQTYGSVYVQNHDALLVSTESELSPHAASLNKEIVPFGGIEIHVQDGTCVLTTQQLVIPVEVIFDQEQLEAQYKNPNNNVGRSGRRYKTTAKVRGKRYNLRSSLGSDRVLRSKSVDNAKDVDVENEKTNATMTAVKKRGKKKKSEKNLASNEYSKIRKNVSYMLKRIRYAQSLIDAYSSEGWKGSRQEKLKPDKEIERAKSEIVQRKLKIRDLFQHLDSLCAEGELSEDLFDSEGQIDSEDIFCAKCGSKDITLDNDIILCDGFCERGFHQFCLQPPLPTEDIPPDNEGWLCPGCDCRVECLNLLNETQETKLSMNDGWEKLFPESAAKSESLDPNSGLSTDDSEDDDYDPEKPQNDEENESSSGDSEYATASETSTSDFSYDSEDLTATLVDDGPLTAKRHVHRLDYKKIHDEECGGTSCDESSDDEEWNDAVGKKERKQTHKTGSLRQHSASTKVSAGSQINDSPKSNSAGAKGQSSHPRRLGKEAKERLQVAFNTNHFPDRATKESLAQELGITFQKVDNWFGNARWLLNHPSGRKINMSSKTVVNTAAGASCSKGDQSAVKPKSSSVPGNKLEERSSKSNKITTRAGKSTDTKTPPYGRTTRSRRQSDS